MDELQDQQKLTPEQRKELEAYERRAEKARLHREQFFGPNPPPVDPDTLPYGPRYATSGPEMYRPRNIREYNALKHGMCANTAVLPGESQEEYDRLHARWRREYGNPEEDTILFDLVHSAADAAWEKRRNQRQFEIQMAEFHGSACVTWVDDDHRRYQLAERYRTASDRKFQREFKMLESYVKSKNAKAERAEKRLVAEQRNYKSPEQLEEEAIEAELEKEMDRVRHTSPLVVNMQTGEMNSMDKKVHIPAPPDWVPMKVVPGERHPLDPSRIRETIRECIVERRRLEREQQPQKAA